ncbi:Y+L amino acid transporter 2-like [Physella acuta]|uniref:Y+L amino acid transporter 2-like n=1 Tax=Physella acuta TaxID=109671 RepID=UPI0027DE6CE7|nr:Y+L amino acid transporter 2-like [Physella acuta]
MADNRQQDTKVQLKRELGLLEAVSLVIGSIIGAGIFVSPKGVIRATGSVGLCLVVWVIAGLACLGDALCFAELGTLIPKSGGMYTYLQLGLGNYVSFLFALQATFLLRPGSLVIFMLTFAKYLVTLLPICGSPQKLEKIIAAAGLVTLYLVNCCGTRYGAQVAKVTTLCKLLALGVIIVAGLVAISQGVTSELGTGFQDSSTEVSSLALALYSAMFATRGGAEVNNVIEEIKNPSK